MFSLDDCGIASRRILEETPCSRRKYQPKVTTSTEVAATSVKKLLLNEGSCRILTLGRPLPNAALEIALGNGRPRPRVKSGR